MEELHEWVEGEDNMDFVEIAYEMWEDGDVFCKDIESCSWEELFKNFTWPGDLVFLTHQEDAFGNSEWVLLCLVTDSRG